jgi:hypothetical protein
VALGTDLLIDRGIGREIGRVEPPSSGFTLCWMSSWSIAVIHHTA